MRNASPTAYKLAHRRLQSIREIWHEEHVAAMDCLAFEAILEGIIELHDTMAGIFAKSRQDVFSGIEEPSAERDEHERSFLQFWSNLSSEMVPQLQKLEREYQVAGAPDFRRCISEVQLRLANWKPALPSKAIGFRVDRLDEEEAADLRRIIEEGAITGEGRSKLPPSDIPEGDPELLLRRFRASAT